MKERVIAGTKTERKGTVQWFTPRFWTVPVRGRNQNGPAALLRNGDNGDQMLPAVAGINGANGGQSISGGFLDFCGDPSDPFLQCLLLRTRRPFR
jgi:hypothetical protein